MMIKKILTLFLTIITLSNCRWFTGAGTTFLSGTKMKIPDGTPKFKKGFKDGCGTLLYARGNIFYRTLYNHHYDPKLIRDSEYNFGYKRGYFFCFHYSVGSGQFSGGSDLFIMPKEGTPFTQGMTAGNLDNSWNYGNLDWGIGGGGNAPNGLDSLFAGIAKSNSTGTAVGGGGALGSHFLWGTSNTGQIFGAGSSGQYGMY